MLHGFQSLSERCGGETNLLPLPEFEYLYVQSAPQASQYSKLILATFIEINHNETACDNVHVINVFRTGSCGGLL
jgi:hypothetical protein